jgi:hypothetical protein
MTINKMDYIKHESKKVPLTALSVKSTPRKESVYIPTAPIGYKKEDPTLSPALFTIISGGEKREKDYFKLLIKGELFPRVKVIFIDRNAHGETGLDPQKLLYEAIKRKVHTKMKKSYDEGDKYYLVTDVDHFSNDLRKIHPICKMQKLHLIISNPCFEVWLYYSEWSTKPDFVKPENTLKTSHAFKHFLDEKKKGGIDPRKAIYKIEENIRNAKDNFKMEDDVLPAFLSTNMFELMERMLPLFKAELTTFLAEKKKGRRIIQ